MCLISCPEMALSCVTYGGGLIKLQLFIEPRCQLLLLLETTEQEATRIMNFLEETYKRWICPSDRELTLRAKLRAGWSSRSQNDGGSGINEAEQAAITEVLERANRLQAMEEERVRKLNERLEKIKRQACGNGKKSCILCNDQPKLFSNKFYTCKDCHNAVCNKCSIDTHEVETDETIWLCKICSESREVLKKTNMWTQLCSSAESQR